MRHALDDTDRRIAAALLASPRASWRTVARCLGVSERTVVRRAGPLFYDGVLRATAVGNPACFPGLFPMALRIRCRPRRIRAVAATLARRPDTVWVDVLGGGDEICTVVFLDGPDARNDLLLRDLPATAAVDSWTSHTLLRVFPAGFAWTGGLLSPQELESLRPDQPWTPTAPPAPLGIDDALIAALTEDARTPCTELARRAGTSALTARRRLDTLVRGHVLRLATEVDLALLGAHTQMLLWLTVAPGALEETARSLAAHPQVWFTAATTGHANLLVALATSDPTATYTFLTDTIGPLPSITTTETTPILTTHKRTGLPRHPSP